MALKRTSLALSKYPCEGLQLLAREAEHSVGLLSGENIGLLLNEFKS